MGRGLVGDHVGPEPGRQQLGEHVGGVADQPDRDRPALGGGPLDPRCRVGQVVGPLVQVAALEAAGQALGVDLDAQGHPLVHGHGQRLGPAHAAEAPREHDLAGQAVPAVGLGDGGEGLVGALEDALGADVDPGPGGHLAVHGEPGRLQLAEPVPAGPFRHQQGIGEQHPGGEAVGPEHPDRLARLDQQGLVVAEPAQGGHDPVEGRPVAGRPAGAAVHDQVVGPLGDLGVEVVAEHPQGGLLLPAPAGQLGPPRGADDPCTFHVAPSRPGHPRGPATSSAAATRVPSATRCSTAARSGAR